MKYLDQMQFRENKMAYQIVGRINELVDKIDALLRLKKEQRDIEWVRKLIKDNLDFLAPALGRDNKKIVAEWAKHNRF